MDQLLIVTTGNPQILPAYSASDVMDKQPSDSPRVTLCVSQGLSASILELRGGPQLVPPVVMVKGEKKLASHA